MIKFTVYGAVPSKSNSYKIIKMHNHASLAKSSSLREYEKMFFLQVPADHRGKCINSLMKAEIAVYYTSNRLDIDNSAKIILDCLEASKVIKNDNKIVDLHMTKHIDKEKPRCEIVLSTVID